MDNVQFTVCGIIFLVMLFLILYFVLKYSNEVAINTELRREKNLIQVRHEHILTQLNKHGFAANSVHLGAIYIEKIYDKGIDRE